MSQRNLILIFIANLLLPWIISICQTAYTLDSETAKNETSINFTMLENIRNNELNESLYTNLRNAENYIKQGGSVKNLVRDACISHLENTIDATAMHEDYICLANYEVAEGNLANAIKHLSKAQDLIYFENTEKMLNKIISSNEGAGGGLAAYRLSLIEQFGRTDSRYQRKIDIEKAFAYRTKAVNLLQIPQIKSINIAMTFDSKYLRYAIPSIISMLLSSNLDSKYSIHIVHDDTSLSESEIKQITKLKNLIPFSLSFTKITSDLGDDLSLCDVSDSTLHRYSKYTFWRTFLHKILNFEKVLYIDPDTIVLTDLSQLYEYDIKNYAIAAVADQIQYKINSDISRKDAPYPYFNAGVLLLNLKAIRDSKTIESFKLSDIKINCSFPDQDVLNFIFQKNVRFLGYNWNRYAGTSREYHKKILPNIIHFAGKIKADNDKASSFLSPELLGMYNHYDLFGKKFLDMSIVK